MSVLNFTPTSIPVPSLADGVAGVAELGQIVQGHVMVVKFHENGAAITLPELSVAPLTVAVNVVPCASGALAVNVAALVVAFQPTVPGTEVPPDVFSVKLIEDGTTGLLKLATAGVLKDAFVVFGDGDTLVTPGATVSTKLLL